jgi:transcription elongation factor GreB
MSRWRPPQPKSSPYITAQGYKNLETELRDLWAKRSGVTEALAAAAAEGDRSENAEYIYRKKELRAIDRRIGYLQKRMPSLTVVTKKPEDLDKVYFGAWVTLGNDAGDEFIYRIVGTDEIDPKLNYISLDSPLAKALLKKSVDDEVVITIAEKQFRSFILQIEYKD